jgi:hypothetical protein
VLGNFSSQTILEKWCLAKISQTCDSLGSTGLSGVHRTVPGAQATQSANMPLSGNCWDVVAIIHRTVRCASRMSGQRSVAQSASSTSPWPTVTRLHRTVRCAKWPMTGNGRLGWLRKGIGECAMFDVHRTVWCTRRKKATGAFQMKFKRLLVPWGYKKTPRCLRAVHKHTLNIL